MASPGQDLSENLRKAYKEERLKKEGQLSELPDDALSAEFASYSASKSRINLLIGLAVIAALFGLVFTDTGHRIFDEVLQSINRS